MKLKEWLEELNELVDHNPNMLEMDIVTSSDDEGNSFNTVQYTPSFGIFIDDEFEQITKPSEATVVCLN